MIRAGALALALLFVAAPARADLWTTGPKSDPLETADQLVLRALEARDSNDFLRSRRLAERAAEAYGAAASEADDDRAAEAHYRAGEILYAFFIANVDRPRARTSLRAIEHWNAFQDLAPDDPRLSNMLFHRSIVRTKLASKEQLRRALDDYQRYQSLATESDRDLTTVFANSAEIHMALGELDQAIEHYQRALDLRNEALHGYGLAVALDRDGQETKAREVMAQHAGGDKLAELSRPDVFFIPAGDIHYYLGLGFEVLGRYRQSAEQYQAFTRALPNSPYVTRAREHYRRVAAKARKSDRPIDRTRVWH